MRILSMILILSAVLLAFFHVSATVTKPRVGGMVRAFHVWDVVTLIALAAFVFAAWWW